MIVMKFGGTSVADAEAIEPADRDRRATAGRARTGRRRRRSSWCRRCRSVTDRLLEPSRLAGERRRRRRAQKRLRDLLRARIVAVADGLVRARSATRLVDDVVDASSTSSTRIVARAGGPARGVAALARRASSRWASSRAAASSRPRFDRARDAGRLGRRARRARHRRRAHRGGARHATATTRGAASDALAARAPARSPCIGGFIGATRERRHHDARARRIGLLGGDLRRRASASTRSRSGPTSTAC